jgi:hypothetical protein
MNCNNQTGYRFGMVLKSVLVQTVEFVLSVLHEIKV